MSALQAVLVADHEPEVAEMARRYLARAGLAVRVTASPEETLEALASRSAGIFVIDLTMPGLDVTRVRRVLASGGPVPVVFLLDRYGVRPRSLARDGHAGVRRWLARPFSPRALVDAVTELGCAISGVPGAGGIPGGGPGRREVTVAGRTAKLTRSEFALFAALARHPGRPLGREELLAALEAERGKRPGPRAVDVYITQLRAKLGPDAIATVHGIGYALRVSLGSSAPQGG